MQPPTHPPEEVRFGDVGDQLTWCDMPALETELLASTDRLLDTLGRPICPIVVDLRLTFTVKTFDRPTLQKVLIRGEVFTLRRPIRFHIDADSMVLGEMVQSAELSLAVEVTWLAAGTTQVETRSLSHCGYRSMNEVKDETGTGW